jgi:hypothetical protein
MMGRPSLLWSAAFEDQQPKEKVREMEMEMGTGKRSSRGREKGREMETPQRSAAE